MNDLAKIDVQSQQFDNVFCFVLAFFRFFVAK